MFDIFKHKQTQHEIVRSIMLTDIEAEKDMDKRERLVKAYKVMSEAEALIEPKLRIDPNAVIKIVGTAAIAFGVVAWEQRGNVVSSKAFGLIRP